jgi:hypothetical protein
MSLFDIGEEADDGIMEDAQSQDDIVTIEAWEI